MLKDLLSLFVPKEISLFSCVKQSEKKFFMSFFFLSDDPSKKKKKKITQISFSMLGTEWGKKNTNPSQEKKIIIALFSHLEKNWNKI